MRRRTRQSKLRTWARRVLRGVWALLTLVVLSVLFAALSPVTSYALDLTSHFLPHALLAGIASLALSVVWKGRWATVVSGATALVVLFTLLTTYQTLAPGGGGDAPTRTLRVTVYNAFSRGTTREGSELDSVFRQWLIDEQVDLVCIVDPPWNIRRSGLWPGEPYLPHIVDDLTPHGRRTVTLLSRYPLRREPLTESGDPEHRLSFAAHHSVVVEFPAGGEALFTGAHPRSPRDERAWRLSQRWTDVDARLLGAWRANNPLPVIFAGDFNTTPAGVLHDLIVRKTGLRSPTRPFSQGSWPAHAPTFLALPIDRVYVSEDVRVTSVRVGPRVYSDHRPVLYELEVPVVSSESESEGPTQNAQ